MKLKNIFLSLIAAAMACNPLAAMYERPSYAPAIVCFAGATASGITAWWAHKKVKSLHALSDKEKNNPEIRTKIKRYTYLRNACIIIGSSTAIAGLAFSTASNPEPNTVQTEQEAQAQRRRTFEEQQQRRRQRRAQEEPHAHVQRQQNQRETQPRSAEELLARGFARAQREDTAQRIAKAARAAQKANHECGICLEKITNPSNFTVGSPSYQCDHFFCKPCITEQRRGYTYNIGTENDPINIPVSAQQVQRCPVCRQA